MEIEKKKVILKEEKHKNGDMYYLLHGSNTWELEDHLFSLNSCVVKSYVCSSSQQYEEWNKHVHQTCAHRSSETILPADHIKKEHLHPNNECNQADRFCNILQQLLEDDTVHATNTHENNISSYSNCKREKLSPVDEKSFTCSTCDKRFTKNSTLQRHQLTHTGDKHFACNICNKRFAQNSNMKKHQLTHTGEKHFACNLCKRRFTQNSTLQRHQLTHTGDKPFACSICNTRFARNSNMKKHQLTHTGEKPFKCNICNKKFVRNYSLKMHQLTHTGENHAY